MPRFRLRTFLIAITAFCLLLGWRVAAVESVERPIRELERLGWEVSYQPKVLYFTNPGGPMPRRSYLQKLCLGYRGDDLPNEVSFPTLEWRVFKEGQKPGETPLVWVDQSVTLINRLPTIRAVSISSKSLTADGLAPLADLKHVKHLDLSDGLLDDGALRMLINLTQLESLDVYGTGLSHDAVRELKKWLPDCAVSSEYRPARDE